MFEEVGLNVFSITSNVESAIEEAVLNSKSQETIFIIGSIFLVGEGLDRLQILGYK
jgi:folylpolyglutamate synthase/dihydropteroate synthase